MSWAFFDVWHPSPCRLSHVPSSCRLVHPALGSACISGLTVLQDQSQAAEASVARGRPSRVELQGRTETELKRANKLAFLHTVGMLELYNFEYCLMNSNMLLPTMGSKKLTSKNSYTASASLSLNCKLDMGIFCSWHPHASRQFDPSPPADDTCGKPGRHPVRPTCSTGPLAWTEPDRRFVRDGSYPQTPGGRGVFCFFRFHGRTLSGWIWVERCGSELVRMSSAVEVVSSVFQREPRAANAVEPRCRLPTMRGCHHARMAVLDAFATKAQDNLPQ